MDPWEKSKTVDPEVRAYITSLVNAIGGRSTYDESYAIGDDAIAVLKDLKRWIQLYDERINRHDVKRCLAEANIVKGDLLEILAQWPEETTENKFRRKLALGCLELLVPLTWPLDLDIKEDHLTVNFHRHVPYLQLAQVQYKRALLGFDGANILRTIVRIGLPSMAQPRRERSRRDEGVIRLMLYLFRNVAMITQPQHLPSQGDENETTRSATIDAFHSQDILSLLLTLGSSVDEFREDDVVLLEILYNLLKGVDAKKLFMKKENVAKDETKEFKDLLSREKAMLDSYKKHAPTRHHRFGTMVWVKRDDTKFSTMSGQQSITNEDQTLYQMDKSKKWDKPKYRGKLAKEFNEKSDFGMRVDLTDSARKHLRSFVEDFLDSSFNPLFSCLRRTIERDEDRLREENKKQYFYLISWFLTAGAARRDAIRRENCSHADRPTQMEPEENTYAYIAAVLDQETFVLLNTSMQHAFDEKDWQKLQATLLAFTQILLTVQSMAESKDEGDQEIAENIQSRIFYEEATHDRIVAILRGYTHQGFAYLDTITECTHVFVRMLERYSKTNVDLQIRSKRRARKKTQRNKAQQPAENPTEGGDQEEQEEDEQDEQDAQRVVSERKFDFARFSAKFLNQKCVDTFVSLLHFYAELTPAQLKRCHRYFYRLAFKAELSVLVFRVDILLLFHRLIKGPEGLDPAIDGFKEWEQLVQQIFRKCVKWVSKETEGEGWKELCVIEMLFSKIGNTVFYLQNGFDRTVEKRAPRPPAELEFKAAVEEGQRLGVAVGALLEQGKPDAVAWVKEEFKRAVDEREAWEQANAMRREQEGLTQLADPAQDEAPGMFLKAATDERKAALFKDKHLRLLLTELGYQRLGVAEDTDAAWLLPPNISSTILKESLDKVQQAEFDPPTFEDGKSATNLLRNKGSYNRDHPRTGLFDDASDPDGGDSDTDMPDAEMREGYGPDVPLKRKRDPNAAEPKKRRRLQRKNAGKDPTESEVEARDKALRDKQREKEAKVNLSRQFITASDDESDEERDAEFFRHEEARRQKMKGVIRTQMLKAMGDEVRGASQSSKVHTERAKKKIRAVAREMGENENEVVKEVMEEMGGGDVEGGIEAEAPGIDGASVAGRDTSESEDDAAAAAEDEDEDTPSTSPAALEDPLPSKEVQVDATATGAEAGTAADGEDEDDAPVKRAPSARRMRAGFVLDDSDSE